MNGCAMSESRTPLPSDLSAMLLHGVFKADSFNVGQPDQDLLRGRVLDALRVPSHTAHSDHATRDEAVDKVRESIEASRPIVFTQEEGGHLGIVLVEPYPRRSNLPMYNVFGNELQLKVKMGLIDTKEVRRIFGEIAKTKGLGLPFAILAYSCAGYKPRKIIEFFNNQIGESLEENVYNGNLETIREIFNLVRTGNWGNEKRKGVSLYSKTHFDRVQEYLKELDQGVNREDGENPFANWSFDPKSIAYGKVRADFDVYPNVVLWKQNGSVTKDIFTAYLIHGLPRFPLLETVPGESLEGKKIWDRMEALSELQDAEWEIINNGLYAIIADEFDKYKTDKPSTITVVDFCNWYLNRWDSIALAGGSPIVVCILAIIRLSYTEAAVIVALNLLGKEFPADQDINTLKSLWPYHSNTTGLEAFVKSVRSYQKNPQNYRELKDLVTALGINTFRI